MLMHVLTGLYGRGKSFEYSRIEWEYISGICTNSISSRGMLTFDNFVSPRMTMPPGLLIKNSDTCHQFIVIFIICQCNFKPGYFHTTRLPTMVWGSSRSLLALIFSFKWAIESSEGTSTGKGSPKVSSKPQLGAQLHDGTSWLM